MNRAAFAALMPPARPAPSPLARPAAPRPSFAGQRESAAPADGGIRHLHLIFRFVVHAFLPCRFAGLPTLCRLVTLLYDKFCVNAFSTPDLTAPLRSNTAREGRRMAGTMDDQESQEEKMAEIEFRAVSEERPEGDDDRARRHRARQYVPRRRYRRGGQHGAGGL